MLSDLISRITASDGADLILDFAIHQALGRVPEGYGIVGGADGYFRKIPEPGKSYQGGSACPVPRYTMSLDAALTVAPRMPEDEPAVFWRVGHDREGADPADFLAELNVCDQHGCISFSSIADSAPLALCAAALKYRLRKSLIEPLQDRGNG